MGLESGVYISDLVDTNPTGQDGMSAGDDHIRLIKNTLLNTFSNVEGEVTAAHGDLNRLAEFADKTEEERRTALGLGAMAGVGSVSNTHWDSAAEDPLAVENGGTGAESASDARDNLELGTAATVNVQEDLLDETAGRVLVRGGHGLGGSAVNVSDSEYDAYTACGFINADSSATGAGGLGSANHNIAQWGSGQRRTQLIGPGSGDNGLNLVLKQYNGNGNSQGTSRIALEDTQNDFSVSQTFENGAYFDDGQDFRIYKSGTRCMSRSDDGTDWGWYDGAGGNYRMRLTTGGNLHVGNNITAYSGSVGSDIRHKTEITTLSPKEAQDLLDQVKPKIYWNEKLERWDVGVVAQQFLRDVEGAEFLVQEVEDPDTGGTRLVFNYVGLGVYALAARFQDVRDREELEDRVNNLEDRLRQLEV